MKKFFIITVDTECDNCWNIRNINENVSTENARFLPRFQSLCEEFSLIPTYLTNYEMANSQDFVNFGRECLKRGTAEIGAHLHAWNQPPYFPLLKSPFKRGKPYLGEYPTWIIEEKIEKLTLCLIKNFETEVKSFRSGRWYMDAAIVRGLEKNGYLVDCTCTPGVNWSGNPGWTLGRKGTDWSVWSNKAGKIGRIGLEGIKNGKIIEVPVTIEKEVVENKSLSWLRPDVNNQEEMKKIIDRSLNNNSDYVEFMIHSSELMPHGSPKFSTRFQVEKLYESIECIFRYAVDQGFSGIGLSDYVREKFL